MKLESGKAYVTRDGKHTVIVRGPYAGRYPYDGAVAGRPAEWDADGFFFVAGMPNDLDLVTEADPNSYGALKATLAQQIRDRSADENHMADALRYATAPGPVLVAGGTLTYTPDTRTPLCTCEMHGPQGLMAVGCTCGAPIRA